VDKWHARSKLITPHALLAATSRSSATKLAPPATKAHFLARHLYRGDAIVARGAVAEPRLPAQSRDCAEWKRRSVDAGRGCAGMDRAQRAEVENCLLSSCRHEDQPPVRAALPVDAVYICSPGAG